MEEQVTISKAEYHRLLKAKENLDALEAAGVENWWGYEDAMGHYPEMIDEDDDDRC